MEHTKKNIIELTLMDATAARAAQKLPVMVLMDSVRSLLNVGSILRTCDALGVAEAVMCGITGTPPHPEIAKTALGAEESVAWRHVEDCLAEVRRLQAEGWTVCVLEQAHNSLPLGEFQGAPGAKYALLCGNEVHGVDQRIVDAADLILEIPQHGAKHSMNVAVSTGIALWQITQNLR